MDELIRRCGRDILLVHIHIPKTGGTTLSETMRQCAAEKGMRFAYGHMENFLNMTSEDQSRTAAIDAHMGYGIHLHPLFPKHRRSCTVYYTVVRPYVDVLWSAMGHLHYVSKKWNNETNFAVPWTFSGALSYQLCCWSDSQHPPGSLYERGKLKWMSSNAVQLDPSCPRSLEEAASCSIRRLCRDFSFVGSTGDMEAAVRFVRKVMSCSGSKVPHSNSHSNEIPLDEEREKELERLLLEAGAATDAAVLKFGGELASGRRGGCRKLV